MYTLPQFKNINQAYQKIDTHKQQNNRHLKLVGDSTSPWNFHCCVLLRLFLNGGQPVG